MIRKTNKSEFTNELKAMLTKPIPKHLPTTTDRRAIIIDFMAYARKVPIKKQCLKTYNDFFTSLWSTFASLSETCNRVDIVFDVYNENSVKASERSRRIKKEGNETILSCSIPVDIDRFWPVAKNKVALQQLFTKWTIEKVYREDFGKSLFLGGSHKESDAMCYSIINSSVNTERLLECSHEEADDRIFFHVNHAIKVGRNTSVVIASPDTDMFVAATHHFNILKKYFALEELWFVSGRSGSRICFPIHDLANDLDPELTEVLPAIHALTGCDTASKVGTKSRAVKEGPESYPLLYSFGRDELSEEMISNAEKFLIKCITKHNVDTFDELRYIIYHEKHLQFDIERFPPTSTD